VDQIRGVFNFLVKTVDRGIWHAKKGYDDQELGILRKTNR